MANVIIDEKNRNKEEIEAMEVAEASREQTWDHPSFVADLFMGKLRSWDGRAVSGSVRSGSAHRRRLLRPRRDFLQSQRRRDQIDRDGQIPDAVMKGLAELGASA